MLALQAVEDLPIYPLCGALRPCFYPHMSTSSAEPGLNDPGRLRALRHLRLLDSQPEVGFDRITRLAARVLGVPVCLVSLVDDRRQFFKSAHGLGGPVGEARQTPLTHSFCQHVVTSGAPLVVEDAKANPLVCDNLAIRDLGVRAYLGVPIRSPDGFVFGSFCVIDTQPRAWLPRELELLGEFAGLVDAEIARRAATIQDETTLTRLRAVLDGTMFSVIATTPEGVIELFNKGAEQMLGYAAEEVLGRLTPEPLHVAEEVVAVAAALSAELGRTVAAGFETFATLATLGRTDEREWTYVRKDGSRLPVLLSVTALRDADGDVTGFLGIARDITARRQAEEERTSLAALLHKTGEMARVGGWELDLATMQPVWSLETCRIHEVDPPVAPPLDQAIYFYAPEARPVIEAAVREGVAHGTSWDMELPLITAKGRPIWVRTQGSAVMREGRAVKLFGAFQDITERRAAEAAIRESEERFRTLAQHAPVGIFQTDANGLCRYVNARWSALAGLTPVEAAGDGWGAALHPEDRAGIFAEWAAFSCGEREFALEYRFLHGDGRVVSVVGSGVALRDAGGAVTGFLGTVSDVTARKELETNLALARDQALEGSRLKSEFLATMSHEIRTPMNAVVGMAGLLADTTLTAEQEEMVGMMVGGAETLLTIINDILDFSRIEAGQLRMESSDFDFRRVVEDTVGLLAARAHEKGVELTCEFASVPTQMVLGDGGRVRQVLTNLLGNAIKFTDRGEVAVRVEITDETAQRTRLRVTVCDTGVGIPAEAQPRLFQPFMQADGSTTRRFGGTGLGLAISRQLVDLMVGEIGFESEAGKGSRFWFELEFIRRSASAPEPVFQLPAGRRVLVVDDNETNRRIVLGQLARWDVEAEAVAGGEAALARLRDRAAGPWHLILVDWHMPGMSGLELAMAIRADPELTDIPQVMLSSAGPQADIGTVAAAGFAAFLTKPVTAQQLGRCVARVLAATPADAVPLPPVKIRPKAMQPGGNPLRMLLVEDNPANQRVATLLMTKMGYSVELAVNGECALAELQRRKFDVVLMDCQMPVMDGFEATRRIRAGERAAPGARLPIIALTAYARVEDRKQCLDAGMDDYVTKPIRPAELRAALERCGLEDRAAAAGAEEPRAAPAETVLDETALATVRDLSGPDGLSLLPEIVRLYLSDEAERLGRLRTLVREKQTASLADEAHAFAGNAAVFGGLEVKRLALELERVARAEAWTEAAAALVRLEGACESLRGELARLNLC